jgi:hypothetical protein
MVFASIRFNALEREGEVYVKGFIGYVLVGVHHGFFKYPGMAFFEGVLRVVAMAVFGLAWAFPRNGLFGNIYF